LAILAAVAWLLAGGPWPAAAGAAVPGSAAGAPAGGPAAGPAAPATDALAPAPPDLEAMLAAVCGAGRVAAASSPARRECRGVPAYPTPCKGPLQIDAVVRGSFTRPLAAEALADYEGGRVTRTQS